MQGPHFSNAALLVVGSCESRTHKTKILYSINQLIISEVSHLIYIIKMAFFEKIYVHISAIHLA